MADFEKGQFFFDKRAINHQGTKGKYFIGLNDAEYEDDVIVCFVINSEYRMDRLRLNCNKDENKFVLKPDSFQFIKHHSSIMLAIPNYYKLIEMYLPSIKLLDKADDLMCRQIKNCIDWSYIIQKYHKLIKDCFKSK